MGDFARQRQAFRFRALEMLFRLYNTCFFHKLSIIPSHNSTCAYLSSRCFSEHASFGLDMSASKCETFDYMCLCVCVGVFVCVTLRRVSIFAHPSVLHACVTVGFGVLLDANRNVKGAFCTCTPCSVLLYPLHTVRSIEGIGARSEERPDVSLCALSFDVVLSVANVCVLSFSVVLLSPDLVALCRSMLCPHPALLS